MPIQYIIITLVKKCDDPLQNYSNCKYPVGVGNATDALEMLVTASGIGAVYEVIISTHTMIATASAISANGAVPVPVECGSDHLIDPESIIKEINSRTRCIMPTQLNGRTAKMDDCAWFACATIAIADWLSTDAFVKFAVSLA